MKMVRKTSVAGAFARKEPYDYDGTHYDADITNGDIVKFTSTGDIVTGEYGEQHVFSITTRNGEKNVALNQSSINCLIEEFGDESEGWLGREVMVSTRRDVVAGKKVIIAYLHPKNWVLNEWGELEKRSEAPQPVSTPNTMPRQVQEAQALDPADIPF